MHPSMFTRRPRDRARGIGTTAALLLSAAVAGGCGEPTESTQVRNEADAGGSDAAAATGPKRPNSWKRDVPPEPAPAVADGGAARDACASCPVALFVTAAPGNEGDDVIAARLRVAGFEVVVQPHLAATTPVEVPPGAKVVVVSESVSSSAVNSKFLSSPLGVVVMEPSIQDDMLLTGPTDKTDYGADNTTNALDVIGTGDLAAGFKGAIEVALGTVDMTWGIPGPEAMKIATLAGQPTKLAIYAYEAGAMMVGARTPARRVVSFLHTGAAKSLNKDGAKLFEAAVRWAAATKVVAVPPPPTDGGAPAVMDAAPAPDAGAPDAAPDAAPDMAPEGARDAAVDRRVDARVDARRRPS